MKTENIKEGFARIIVVTTLLIVCGCNKEADFQNYLKGNIDGVPFECTTMAANEPGNGSNSPDDPHLRIEGSWLNNSIKIHLLNEGTLTTKAYQFEVGKERYAIIYENNSNNYEAGYFWGLGYSAFYGSGKVTITEISKKSVKGIFEFVAPSSSGTSTRTVTGEFHLKRS